MTETTASSDDKYERSRVPRRELLDGGYFAAGYTGEHVAGGEFVVGAAFAAWGASPGTVIGGLILGNLLAVLAWALICSPIAVRARITLYYFVEKMAGRKFLWLFGLLNGLIFVAIAGGMVTISASAIRGLTGGPQQIHVYPTSALFVIFALILGVVMIAITLRGFEGLSRFAKVCAPWLLTIFVISGLASLPHLIYYGQQEGIAFGDLFSHYIWTGKTADGSAPFSVWQVAAIAFTNNLALHLGMGDMSTLRFAKRKEYGFYSVFATFGGHFVAWLACGILGATTATILTQQTGGIVRVGDLDIGGVVVPVLGVAGTAAVIIASITTAVPSLYRAGLAFQSLVPKQSLAKVTIITGAITTIIACSPVIFMKWLGILAFFNITLTPIGALIFAEHYVLPRMGYSPFWRSKGSDHRNIPAWTAWGVSMALALILSQTSISIFFIFAPVWVVCFIVYAAMVKSMRQPDAAGRPVEAIYSDAYGDDDMNEPMQHHSAPINKALFADTAMKIVTASLIGMILISLLMFIPSDPTRFRINFHVALAVLSVVYFAAILTWRKKYQVKG